MSALLVRLNITREATISHRSGDKVTQVDRVSENGLTADFIVSSQEDEDTKSLGFVRLRIETNGDRLPKLDTEAMGDWLCVNLKKML